jgi:hypothetical protein
MNILNKKSRTAHKGGGGSLHIGGLGVGLTTPHRQKSICYKMLNRALYLDRFFEGYCEQGNKPSGSITC